MHLDKAVEGFLLHKSAEGLSGRTLESYQDSLKHLSRFLNNPEVTSITTDDLRRFFHYLRHEYVPNRVTGDRSPLSSRSIRNYWVACRSFYTWAKVDLSLEDALAPMPAPKATSTTPDPLTQEEVQALLKVAGQGRKQCIVLVLLDTGIRVSELCAIKVADVHLRTGKVFITGKGNKERFCYLGSVTRRALWKYLNERDPDPGDPLFATTTNEPLARDWVRRILADLGNEAKVPKVYPHRFRHTFAVQFLRNGGNIFTLQILLGHSSLVMVRHYASLAAADAEKAHRQASPADNWLT